MPSLRAQFVLSWLLFTPPCFPQTTAGPLADRGSAAATEQVRLSEILISTPQPYDPAQVAEAQRKAEQVRVAIGRGGTFADIARANSQGPTAGQGGDIGCFTHGKLAQTLDELVFRMQPGDVSDVVRTKQGFVILKVSNRSADPCADLELLNQPITLLNQPITAELEPFLETLIQRVHERWYELVPRSARQPEMRRGSVTIEFSVQRNGAITDQRVASGSGDIDLDKAALPSARQARSLRCQAQRRRTISYCASLPIQSGQNHRLIN